jgi:hypothetical protein
MKMGFSFPIKSLIWFSFALLLFYLSGCALEKNEWVMSASLPNQSRLELGVHVVIWATNRTEWGLFTRSSTSLCLREEEVQSLGKPFCIPDMNSRGRAKWPG